MEQGQAVESILRRKHMIPGVLHDSGYVAAEDVLVLDHQHRYLAE
jgi:hypothetical protein